MRHYVETCIKDYTFVFIQFVHVLHFVNEKWDTIAIYWIVLNNLGLLLHYPVRGYGTLFTTTVHSLLHGTASSFMIYRFIQFQYVMRRMSSRLSRRRDVAALLSLLLLPKKTHVQARASIGGGRGTRPPLFSLGESIGNVPPHFFQLKTQIYRHIARVITHLS